jgi:hypothetical protein
VHVVIFILFKPTHALFLKHIHIHIWNTKLLKMFVKHLIKNPTCFGQNCLTILKGPSSVLSAVTTSLLVCVVKLFIWYVAVCCLCVCVPDVLVCRQVHQAHTHIDDIQPHTK